MADVTVDRFCLSYSCNDARANLKRIQSISPTLWTPSMIEKVRQAVTDNQELTADVGFGQSTVGAKALQIINAL